MGLHRKDLWRSLLSNWVIPEHIHWRSTRLLRKLSQLGLKSKESKHNKTRLPDSPHSTWRKQAHNTAAAAAAKSHQSCPTLCDPIDSSPPGFPIPGILQAKTLEWVAISFFNAWKWKSESEVVRSCLTLSNPMDCSLLGSSVHGIFQARVLEWGAIAFSYSTAKMCYPSRKRKTTSKVRDGGSDGRDLRHKWLHSGLET